VHITGFDKLSLLNYPEKMACTVFTPGCNFRCPFCHNASIVENRYKEYDENNVLRFIKSRCGIIEGVCITGGEPLLQPDLKDFIRKIKDMGLLVKLDTNGYMPDKLKELIDEDLIDYVAMDIKNCFEKYTLTSGTACFDKNRIMKSIEILLEGKVEYEFRTTLVKEFHQKEDIDKICEMIKGAKRYYLQNFEDTGDIIGKDLHGLSKLGLEDYLSEAKQYLACAELRGV